MANTQITTTGLVFPDGSIQTTASNSFKNRIINGAMNINQRKVTIPGKVNSGPAGNTVPNAVGVGYYTSQDGAYNGSNSTANEYYTLDRWNAYASGYWTPPVKQQFKDNSLLQTPNYKYELVVNASTQGSSGIFFLSQKIESIYTQDLVNKVVSIQACLAGNTSYAQKCAYQVWSLASSPIISGSTVLNDGRAIKDYWGTDYVYGFSGSSFNYSSYGPYYSYLNNATLLKTGYWTISNTAAIYTDTFQMPNDASIKNGLMITFWPYISANTANVFPWITNVYPNYSEFRMTGVQFELGTPTPFDYRPVSVEQELCERYCYTVNNWSNPPDYENPSSATYVSGTVNGDKLYTPFRVVDAGFRTYVTAIGNYQPTYPGAIIRVVPNVSMFKTPLSFIVPDNGATGNTASGLTGVRPWKISTYIANTYGQPIYESAMQYGLLTNGPNSPGYGPSSYLSWGTYVWDYMSNVTSQFSSYSVGSTNTQTYIGISQFTSNVTSLSTYTSNTDLEVMTVSNLTVNRQGSNGTTSGAEGVTSLPSTMYNLPSMYTSIYNYDGTTSYSFRVVAQGDSSTSFITEII